MLVLTAILIALVPTIAILWPFVAGTSRYEFESDESAPRADLMHRWDTAVEGLRSAELEHAIGNLETSDYQLVRVELMTEAAIVLKTMELEEAEEQQMLGAVNQELQAVRTRALGEKPSK
ncbi:hypothetical protein M1N23_02365 [Dehalococcoidia bacterium]|nr:hypothetical protein [Dehalococcoidia bacterium]